MIKNIVKKLNVILLVGGRGTRMNEIDANKTYFPKALQLINNKPLIITGSGNETRDFCFIDDAIKGICLILFNETAPCDIYNIATGKSSSINEVATLINFFCNNKVEIEYKKRRDWDCVINRKADISKLKNNHSYSPQTDIEDGLKKTCDWLIDLKK